MKNEKRIYSDLNLKGHQLKGFAVETLTEDPSVEIFDCQSELYTARLYFNITLKRLRCYINGTWQTIPVGDDASPDVITNILVDDDSADFLSVVVTNGIATISLVTEDVDGISHTQLLDIGTYTHDQIDLHLVSTNNPHAVTLEQARQSNGTFAGPVNMGNNKIGGISAGTLPEDAVNLSQLQASILGLKISREVEFATSDTDSPLAITSAGIKLGKTLTANSNGIIVIDGNNPELDERILVKGSTDPIDNGIYTVTTVGDDNNPFVLTRCTAYDDNPSSELFGASYFFVKYGVKNNSTGWVVQSVGVNHDEDPEVDVDPITFIQFSSRNSYIQDGAITINGSVIGWDASIAAGSNLEAVEGKLKVKNYEALDGTYIAVAKTISDFSIGVGKTTLTHNLNGMVNAIVYDSSINSIVEISIKRVNANSIEFGSNKAFTANIELIRIPSVVVV